MKISPPYILYDGECPFCNNYIKLQKFKLTFKNFKLLNARENLELVKLYLDKGYNVDKGMILRIDDKILFADEVVWYMSKITTRDTLFLKFQSVIFKNLFISKLIYPILKFGRFIFFKITFKKFIVNKYFK